MARRLTTALFLLALTCASAQGSKPGFGGPFVLQYGPDQTVTPQTFQGKFLVLFFGYTHCPDACPATLYTLARARAQLGGLGARLDVAFVTVDPARDTPTLTQRYARLFAPDFYGLSGAATALAQVEAAYHVYVGPENPQTGAIAHGDLLYLLGPDGKFITVLPGGLSVAALAAQLAKWMNS